MDETRRVETAFRAAFGRDLPPAATFPADAFADERERLLFFRKAVHFAGAVVGPLQDHGLRPGDRIVDVASGDGEMAAALALKGFPRVTLWDLDGDRLARARRRVEALLPAASGFEYRRADATRLAGEYDAVITCQTIEHLSDEGNYAPASRRCQLEFLRRVRAARPRLVYVNVPNLTHPVDGHDTGLWLFHWLPMRLRRRLLASGRVRCSWAGIARPVSLLFLRRQLPDHRLASRYYAFSSFDEYMLRRPPFDYMGAPYPDEPLDRLAPRKRIARAVANLLGRGAQLCLSQLSLVYVRR